MVDVVDVADAFLEFQEVVDRSDDVGWSDALNVFSNVAVGDQLDFPVRNFTGEDLDFLNSYRFWDCTFIRWGVGNSLEVVAVQVVLQNVHDFVVDNRPLGSQNFSSVRVSQGFSQSVAQKPVLQAQLLVDLVAANSSQVVTAWVKEAGNQEAPG